MWLKWENIGCTVDKAALARMGDGSSFLWWDSNCAFHTFQRERPACTAEAADAAIQICQWTAVGGITLEDWEIDLLPLISFFSLTIHLPFIWQDNFSPPTWWVNSQGLLETLLDVGRPNTLSIGRWHLLIILITKQRKKDLLLSPQKLKAALRSRHARNGVIFTSRYNQIACRDQYLTSNSEESNLAICCVRSVLSPGTRTATSEFILSLLVRRRLFFGVPLTESDSPPQSDSFNPAEAANRWRLLVASPPLFAEPPLASSPSDDHSSLVDILKFSTNLQNRLCFRNNEELSD